MTHQPLQPSTSPSEQAHGGQYVVDRDADQERIGALDSQARRDVVLSSPRF